MRIGVLIVGVILVGAFAAVGIVSPGESVTKHSDDSVPAHPSRASTTVPLAPVTRSPEAVTLPNGTEAVFDVADPFEITTAAEGLGKARFMTMSPDGRMFVPDMVDYKLSHQGKIYVLDDFNEAAGVFETKQTYLSGLRGPNSVAFYTDRNGNQWIYIALTAHLIRYPYRAGDMEPRGEPEVIASFPNDQVPGQQSVVWHITRTIAFKDNRLFVSVGSGCNSCEQPEGEWRGMIYHMNPDGTDKEVYARGLRNAVGFTWADGVLYATENGDDHLGQDAPDDVMYALEKGEHYGWPYCYEHDGAVKKDTAKSWDDSLACAGVPESFAAFGPHTAPLGIAYAPPRASEVPGAGALSGAFLVALHGSFEPHIGNGYEIVRVSPEGEHETFIGGFLGEDGTRYGRPTDILMYGENAFFFTDDYRGRVYYVTASDEPPQHGARI